MSLSTSRQAYADCYEVFDAALESDTGVRIKMKDKDTAIFFRMRMHQARALIKKDNSRVYEDDHPMWGASEYDRLCVRLRQVNGNHYLYVEPYGVDPADIEPITAAEEVMDQLPIASEAQKDIVVVQKILRRI